MWCLISTIQQHHTHQELALADPDLGSRWEQCTGRWGKGISKGNYSDTDLSDNVHFSKDDYIAPQSAEAPTLIFYLVGWPNTLRSSQGITTPLKKLLRATIYDSDSFACCLTSRRICSSAVIPASAKQCLGDKLGKLMMLERDAR